MANLKAFIVLVFLKCFATYVTGKVGALTIYDGTLYAGGYFKSVGGVNVSNIAKWDGSAWSAVGSGVSSTVYALTVYDADLYVGGAFWSADGKSAKYIAKWDGSTWSAVGSGVDNTVRDLAAYGDVLYAGGSFVAAGGVPAYRIARWDGSRWSAVGSGVDRDINALAVYDGALYAGGYFKSAGGKSANYIAKWDGSTWSAVGSGVGGSAGKGMGPIFALYVYEGALYAGGYFTSAGGKSAMYIAKWDGSTWSAVGTGVDNTVRDLAAYGDVLYAGGNFVAAGGVPAYRIARWNGSRWSDVGSGVDEEIHALTVYEGALYAGGYFKSAGGVSVDHIAKWDGSAWSAVGNVVTDAVGLNNTAEYYEGSSSSNTAAIIGGIVGGLAVIAIVAGLTLFIIKRKKLKADTPIDEQKIAQAASQDIQNFAKLLPPAIPMTRPEMQSILLSNPEGVQEPGMEPDQEVRALQSPSKTAGETKREVINNESGNVTPNATVGPISTAATSEPLQPNSSVSSDPVLKWISIQVPATSQNKPGFLSSLSKKKKEQLIEQVKAWEFCWNQVNIVKALGLGSFGKVFLAYLNEAPVAVKVLIDAKTVTADASASSAASAEMTSIEHGNVAAAAPDKLAEESAMLAGLRHPNCVNFLGFCRAPPSIATEYCARGTVFDLVQAAAAAPTGQAAQDLTWARRVQMAIDAAAGMLYLHTRSPPIIHRDLKSPNLLVTAEWTVKICDFNLSKLVDDAIQYSKSTAGGPSNPRWLAPEVLEGGSATTKSDVYAYGLVLWELLVWKLPWTDINPYTIPVKVINGGRPALPPLKDLPGLGQQVPEASVKKYIALMERCWAQNPIERPDFQQIITELRGLSV